MKKGIFIIAALVIVLFGSLTYVFAGDSYIQAKMVQYPIKVNGTSLSYDFKMVNIENSVYLPIRALCDVLGIGIDWNEQEKAVEIMTDTDNDKVAVGYDGIENWDMVDLELTKDDAVKIAEVVFMKRFGSEFIEKTVIGVRESEDKKAFNVFRYQEGVDGGDYTIVVRKSDGKILMIVAGE